MKPSIRKARFPEQGLPGAVDEVMTTDGSACPGGENPFPLPLMSLQGLYSSFGQSDAPPAFRGFGSTHPSIEDSTPYLKASSSKVHIFPLQTQQLSLPHACGNSQEV